MAGWPTEPHYGWSKRANGASLFSTERGGTSTEHKAGTRHEGRGHTTVCQACVILSMGEAAEINKARECSQGNGRAWATQDGRVVLTCDQQDPDLTAAQKDTSHSWTEGSGIKDSLLTTKALFASVCY